uniref:Uncharacterized protein n=1 Tax=Oryza barthii TaxID=65489 RepID=A0A0D3H928_9ORYZ
MVHGSREVRLRREVAEGGGRRQARSSLLLALAATAQVIKDKLMDAIEGHVLGEAQLMAVF